MLRVPVAGYPVNLVVAGRACLVVGGGPVGAGKADGLIQAGAKVTLVAPEVCARAEVLGGLDIHRRHYESGEAAGYRLVVAATSDVAVNDRVCADAEAAGTWASRTDRSGPGDFYSPAVLRRGSLSVAVSTEGTAPVLAGVLRDQLGQVVGEEYEVLVELLGQERALAQAEGRSVTAPDWKRALDSDMLEMIRAGRIDQAREFLHQCLS
ncbi:MAG: precorrin-2 dehydrogenase/sirohydrochlorin ferrochelatase family protein [Acidimicrobiales bacterium]